MARVLNFTYALERNARNWPEKAGYTFGNRTTSNQHLLLRVSSLAAALAKSGVGRGDVVALLLQNCPEFLEAAFAINALGAIWLPLNFRLAYDEWRYIAEHAEAKLLITEPTYHQPGQSLLDELPGLESCWTIGPESPAGWTTFNDELRAHTRAPLRGFAKVDASEVHRLMYTSGTTSRPKGVPLTYGNLHWKNIAQLLEFGLTSGDRVLIVGPMCHVGAMDLPATSVIYAGGSVVILPRFEPELVFDAIERERITAVWLPPAMINMMLAQPYAEHNTSSLRVIVSGGEKMPEPLVERILTVFPGTWFADAYGLTETLSGDTVLDRASVLSKLGSVGRPVAHVEARILDENGRVLRPDQQGEIALRGPKVFSGYWRDPAATARAIRDGWFRTGDIGHLDADGYLYIDDRKADLIVSGGENVASPEIERVLYEHPGILEAAVIAVGHERWGEVPLAVVVARDGVSISAEEVTALCAQKLAKFKVPNRVEFVEALPRTPSGKVLKRTLRERFASSD